MPGPIEIIKSAFQAVPAIRYPLSVAGTIFTIAIIRSFRLTLGTVVFGTILMLVSMTMLVIFARLSSIAPTYFRVPALIFTWFCLFLTMGSALMLFTRTFWGYPSSLRLSRDSEGGETETPGTSNNPWSSATAYAASTEMEAPSSVTFGLIFKDVPIDDTEAGKSSPNHIYGMVEVKEVLKNGPGDLAGIRQGDIIQTAATRPIVRVKELGRIEETHKAGDTIQVSVSRAGKEKGVVVRLGDAASVFGKACDEGNFAGCTNYGYLMYAGRGLSQSKEQATRLFQNACQHGYLRGCAALAGSCSLVGFIHMRMRSV